MPPTDLRVLFYDLETAPLLAYIWAPYDDYVPHDRLIAPGFLLSWSAQWRGTTKIISGCLTGEEAVAQDDRRIVIELADLIREADIIVAHNVDRFDRPVFNTRLLAGRHEPLGPVQTIDTLKLAKSAFRLPYNKLDYLADFLFGDKKIKTDFDLWKRCYHGDEKALKEMLRYNKKDVVLLARVFEEILPYCRNLPRLIDLTEGEVCPHCGSSDLASRGYHNTPTAKYLKKRCGSCGRYSRVRAAERVKPKLAPLS
jgi:hypothetical protein